MKKKDFACFAALAALVLPRYALGGDPPSTEIAIARRLFAEARTAEEAKDWAAAVSKLREAISIKETSGLRFHLAYCEEQQGMLVEALVDYERADDLSVDKDEELRSQIPARRTSLQKRIPTMTLLLSRAPERVRLVVDGRALASTSFGKPIPLNPGKHSFVVTSAGVVPFSAELALNEGDAVVTNVVLAPESGEVVSPSSDVPAPPSAPGSKNGVAVSPARTYVLVGEAAATLGALAVGIAFTLQASSEDERAADNRAKLPGAGGGMNGCHPPVSTPQVAATCAELAAAVDDAQRDRFIAQLGFISAGVGAAAFAATLVLWPSKRPQAAIIHPWIGPGARGLLLEGSF